MAIEEQLKNPIKFKDTKYQYFSDLWYKQSENLTREQKDGMGKAYLKHILGVDEKVIQGFLKMPSSGGSSHAIGMRQAGTGPRKNNYAGFWKEIAEIVPEVYSQNDLEWLIGDAGKSLAFHSLFQINRDGSDKSFVIMRLMENAAAYK